MNKNSQFSSLAAHVMARLLLSFLIIHLFCSSGLFAQVKRMDKVINVGVLSNWPPRYQINQETEKPEGFAIDFFKAITENSSHSYNYKVYPTWAKLFDASKKGEVDVIPNMGMTENRLKDYFFTKPYETFHVFLFVRATSGDIHSVSDMRTKTVGVVANNIGAVLARDVVYEKLITYEYVEKALFELLSGSIDGLIYPASALENIAQQSEISERIRRAGNALLEVKRGVAVVREKEFLFRELDQAVDEILGTEQYMQIYERWYKAPQPYWTAKRVFWVMGTTLGSFVIFLVSWRFLSIWKLNSQLKDTILEREKTQDALIASETRFRQLAEHIKEVFWVVTPDWREVLYISPTYEEVWGKTCQSLYDDPMSWQSSLLEEDREKVVDYLNQTVAGDLAEIVFPDYRVVRPDNTIRWIASRGFPVVNEQNVIYRVAGISEDITEKKAANEVLRASEEQVRLLLNHTGEAIYGVDAEGNCSFANPACVNILGYRSHKDLLHQNIHQLIHSKEDDTSSQRVADCKVEQVLRTPKTIFAEKDLFRRFDGTSIPVEYTAAPIQRDEKIVGAVVTFVDISERLEAENQLRKAKEELEFRVLERTEEIAKLLRAVEQSQSIVVITDYDGAIEYVNQRFYSFYGYSKEEVIGYKTSLLDADNLTRSDFKEVWDTIKAGSNWQGEFHNLKKDGSRSWQLCSISPVIGASGTITHFIATQENIDQKKEAEIRLESAIIEAEKANQAKSTFLANMSHELRTPLNSVIGFTQILEQQSHGELSTKQLHFLTRIREAGDHLLQMVNDVLDLSKIEAEKIELETKPFDFHQMLERIPLTLKSLSHKKEVLVKTEIPADIGWVIGDETRIKQIIYNLLSNAIKFTEPGKKVGIQAGYDDQRVFVTVWDEGIGIHQEDLRRVFEPFEQVKNRVNKEGGTGLGLAISQRLIKLQGGTINAESELGKGSKFTITLPGRMENPNAEVDTAKDAQSLQQLKHQGKKILVTEDNEGNRHLMEIALEKLGLHLEFASSGEEALSKVERGRFDLILMDIQLPGISGTEAMQQIKETMGIKIPIIAVTAFAMKGDHQMFLDSGFDDYVSKPILFERLRQVIDTHLV